MRDGKGWFAAIGLLGMLAAPGSARAQAVGFFPGVGSVPDGVGLSATPVVTADRRYIRLSVGAGFQTVDGFQNFPVPAAVIGGGIGNGGRGVGVLSGMNGPIGVAGMEQAMGPGPIEGYSDVLSDWRPSPRRPRAIRPRPDRAKKPLPDPTVAPIKRKP